MANPNHSKTNTSFSRIWKLLPTVHSEILGRRSTAKWLVEERQNFWMDRGMSTIFWWTKEKIHRGTSPNYAGPLTTLPNWSWCLKIRVRSGPYPNWSKWRPTPCSVHFENIFTNRKKLWNLRPRTPGDHPSTGRMETLHPRIPPHHGYLVRP